jgi:DNA helicase-2/ATP-dependent DNA helicase PcrA
VALTRARQQLHVIHPVRFFIRQQRRYGDQHVRAPRTRFIPDALLDRFTRVAHGPQQPSDDAADGDATPRLDIAARLRAQWS